MSRQPSLLTDWHEKLYKRCWVLASNQVSCSSYRGKLENVTSNQRSGQSYLLINWSKNTSLVEAFQKLLPIKFRQNSFSSFWEEVNKIWKAKDLWRTMHNHLSKALSQTKGTAYIKGKILKEQVQIWESVKPTSPMQSLSLAAAWHPWFRPWPPVHPVDDPWSLGIYSQSTPSVSSFLPCKHKPN